MCTASKAIDYNKKSNIYDLSGEYGIGRASNTNQEFYFDLEDYDKIKDYCWSETVVGPNKNFHVLSAHRKNKCNGTIRVHQVLGFSNYDHIDRNELNNKKTT